MAKCRDKVDSCSCKYVMYSISPITEAYLKSDPCFTAFPLDFATKAKGIDFGLYWEMPVNLNFDVQVPGLVGLRPLYPMTFAVAF